MIRKQIYQNKKYFCVADILKAIGSKSPAIRFLKATPENQHRKFNVTTGNSRIQEVSFATAAGLIPLLQNTGTAKAFEIIAYLQAETGVKIDAPKIEAQPDGISGELIRYRGIAVRYKYEGGKFWFAAMDACVWLALENVSRACEGIPEKYKQNGRFTKDYTAETGYNKIPNTYETSPPFGETESKNKGGTPNILWLDENGLMFLVLGSNNPAVIELKCFLIETILPQLKERGVAFVSPEKELEYARAIAARVRELEVTVHIVNEFEIQKNLKKKCETDYIEYERSTAGRQSYENAYARFYRLRCTEYKILTNKEIEPKMKELILKRGYGVLPRGEIRKNNILGNEWINPGSALECAYKDMQGYLTADAARRKQIDMDIALMKDIVRERGLYPCARGGAKLITAARESDEVATARLVKMYREQNQKALK